MDFEIITIFPDLVEAAAPYGVVGRARNEAYFLRCWNPRDYTFDNYRRIADRPYGGGPGAQTMAASDGAIFLCGRYEAIDQRFLDAMVDEEISMGDFVVSGGELPAMLVMDAVVRLLPGVLNHGESAEQDSFAEGAPAQRLLDCPHYTRPEQLPGWPRDVPAGVPPVLLSGNHREIERWRHAAALDATQRKRPDLLSTKSVLSSKA